MSRFFVYDWSNGSPDLESEEDKEGNHETEKSHSLRQSEAQDGVREQLRLQWWVSGVANNQRAEHSSDSWNKGLHNDKLSQTDFNTSSQTSV